MEEQVTVSEGPIAECGHDRKTLEIIIDLQTKVLALLADGLMKGFTLYFIVVATVFGFIATRSKEQLRAPPADFFNVVTLLQVITALAVVGALLAAYSLARGVRRLGSTLKRYNSEIHDSMLMPSLFRKAVVMTYAAAAVASAALLYIIYISSFFAFR